MGRRNRKSKRKLNSMLMMLLLTAVFMIVSTYAWFSANREVALTGITAKVSAAEGLQISIDGENWASSIEVTQAALTTLGTSLPLAISSRVLTLMPSLTTLFANFLTKS